MTLSRHNLVRNLGPDLDDVRAMPKQGKRLLGSPDRTGKGAGLVNPLNPLPADILDNVKQAANERDFGRLGNKETGFKTAAHNAALSTRSDSATGHFGERSLSGGLTQINEARVPVLARTGGPIPCPGTGPLSPVRQT